MTITKSDLMKRIPREQHGNLDTLHEFMSNSFNQGMLPEKWYARSWLKNPAFYQEHRKLAVEALNDGKVYDDSDEPLPLPRTA